MRAGRGQYRRAYKVVAGAGHQVQALPGNRLRIVQNIDDLRGSALLDTAAGLVLQRRNAALFVARRRVLVNRLVVGDEILLEFIYHANGFIKYIFVQAAGEENVFRAEHFRNLGQNRGAAESDQSVGEAADSRIRGDAGKSVRAAALETDNKFGCRNRLSVEACRVIRKLF